MSIKSRNQQKRNAQIMVRQHFYEEKSNLWYMDTDNFSVYIKTKDLNAGYLQKRS